MVFVNRTLGASLMRISTLAGFEVVRKKVTQVPTRGPASPFSLQLFVLSVFTCAS